MAIFGLILDLPIAVTDSGTVTGWSLLFSAFNPLTIDIDGDGVEINSWEDSKAFFDTKGDGFARSTAWLSKDDAFLAVDWNNDNKISDVNELFGYEEADGFLDLNFYDNNSDKEINSGDSIFNLLRIWQDLNENGYTEQGELKTLEQLNITEISLQTKSEEFSINNNPVNASSSIVKGDGSELRLYDSNFEVNNLVTKYTGKYNLDQSLISLPWLRGYGTVKDLLLEASLDPKLKKFLTDLSSERNSLVVYKKMDELLARWCGVDDSFNGAFSGISIFDKFEILKKYLGWSDHDFALKQSEEVIEAGYLELRNKVYVDFIVQGALGQKLGISYDFFNDQYFIGESFYKRVVDNFTDINDSFSSFLISNTLYLARQLDLGKFISEISNRGFSENLYDYILSHIEFINEQMGGSVTGTAADNLLYSTSTAVGGVVISGDNGNDVLVSTVGADTLQGGAGNDVYILDSQSGYDTIVDASGTDQLILGGGITKENLVLSQSGNHLTLTFDNNPVAVIQDFYTTGTIEKVSFSDGGLLTGADILAMTASITGTAAADTINGNNFVNAITGLGGNDTITGGAGNDTLDGGSGVDQMAGGSGDDRYVVDNSSDVIVEHLLDGNDVVESSVSYTLSENIETIILTGAGNINATGNAYDNSITGNSGANALAGGLGNDTYVIGSTDTVTENENEGIDTIQADFSYTLGNHVENLKLTGAGNINGVGNTLNNTLIGNSGSNTLSGGIGDDHYVVQNTTDVVVENTNEGSDSVESRRVSFN